MMMYTRLIKICNELDNVRDDILNNHFAQSNISDCVLSDIPEIIQLVKELDNGYNINTYQKAYAVVNSIISLVDETRLLNNFKVIRHHLEMFNILY